MAKIYPDTNRFVDFYQAALDSIDVFDELQKYKKNLVLTEQTIYEFRRNRVSTLKWLAGQFKNTINIGSPFTTTVLRAIPGHKELTELFSVYRKKGEEVLKYLKSLISDEQQDPIAKKFSELVMDSAVLKLPLTDNAIGLAQRRKLLGNPPCSPDKHSVGDEVIWELLLSSLKDDLIIVTKDHTFHDNLSLLQEEYKQKTGHKLLFVTERFSEAIKAIGQDPTKELIEVEKKEEQRPATRQKHNFSKPKLYQMLEHEVCPECGHKGHVYGFDGSDGDSMNWFECGKCALFVDLTTL